MKNGVRGEWGKGRGEKKGKNLDQRKKEAEGGKGSKRRMEKTAKGEEDKQV